MEMEMVNDGPERVEATEGGLTVNQDPSSEPTIQAIRSAEQLPRLLSVLSVTSAAKQKKKKKNVRAVIFTFRGEGGDITQMFGPLFY